MSLLERTTNRIKTYHIGRPLKGKRVSTTRFSVTLSTKDCERLEALAVKLDTTRSGLASVLIASSVEAILLELIIKGEPLDVVRLVENAALRRAEAR